MDLRLESLKFFKEKEPIVNERIDQNSTRIGKLEDIITNLGSTFSSVKNTLTPPTKIEFFCMFLKIRVNLLVRKMRISNP